MMRQIRSFHLGMTLAALIVAGGAAKADSTPEVYRSLFQFVKPLDTDWALTAVIGGVENTSYDVGSGIESGNYEAVIAVPFGFEHRFNDNLSLQSYLMFNYELNREVELGTTSLEQPDKLEIRPVIGATLRTNLSDSIEIGTWARYEARFKDVSGESTFENRVRVRPYVDISFAEDRGAGTAWHTKFEVEPKYVIGEDASGDDYSFLNAVMARASIGYSFSHSLSVDLRYSHERGRSDEGADWKDSNDMITLHLVKITGIEKLLGHKVSPIDE